MRSAKLIHFAGGWLLTALLAASCSSAANKPDSSVITCSKDENCPVGQYCANGICSSTTHPCDDSGNCPEGMSCRHGACVIEAGDGGDGGEDGGDEAGDNQGPSPKIVVDDPPPSGSPPIYELNFGSVMVGKMTSKQVVLENQGDADLRILQLNFEMGADNKDFSVPQAELDSLPIVVHPGDKTTIDVNYTASDGLTDHGILDIISNDPVTPLVKIQLLSEFKGIALAQVTPQSLDFGDIPVGQTSNSLSFLVSNQGSGNAVLTMQDIRFGIAANPDFDLAVKNSNSDAVTLPVYLNNGDFLTVAVVYHPQVQEQDSDQVLVVSNDPINPTLKVAITGRGVLGALTVQPSPVDLGLVRVGRHAEIRVTLTNSGGAQLSLTGVVLKNTSAEWSLTSTDLDLANLSTNPKVLNPGDSVKVLLGFDPVDVGQEQGTMEIDNTSPDGTLNVAITATGDIPPKVSTTPAMPVALLFGDVQLDAATGLKQQKVLPVIIQNVGNDPLQITNIQRASMTSPEFTFDPPVIPPIAAGVQVPLNVTFQPNDVGAKTGSILVDTNDPDIQADGVTGRFHIDLQANGIDPNIFVTPPSSVSFGNVYLNEIKSQNVSIRNAGSGSLLLTAIGLTPGSSPQLALLNVPPLPLAITNIGDVEVQVTYQPENLGPATGAIEILSSDIGNPDVIINVTGNGIACPAGQVDCNGDPADGCECGYLHGQAGCSGTTCILLNCFSGYADCDNSPDNGCEISTDTDPANCGSCRHACNYPNAASTCLAGTCVMGSCNTGFADCNSSNADGCETSIWDNVNDCGSCGARCLYDNAVGSCIHTTCILQNCLPGFANCDGLASNGCEIDTTSDPNNCTGCNIKCPGTTGTPVCINGVCGISSCLPGLADCDANPADCETNINTDPNNCGSCGHVCNLPHTTQDTCANGSCAVKTCSPGWGDCDHQDPNGCEQDLTSDVNNCGFCGNICQFAHGTAACQNSACVLLGCDSGYYDVDNNPNNGCECLADTISDVCNDSTITSLGNLATGNLVTVTGNIIPHGDEDWYTFVALDNHTTDISNGSNSYYVQVVFDPANGNPGQEFAFDIYRSRNVSTGCAAKGSPVCSSDVQYEFLSGQVPCRASGVNQSPGAPLCEDEGSRYWLHVYRVASLYTCNPYLIDISFTQ